MSGGDIDLYSEPKYFPCVTMPYRHSNHRHLEKTWLKEKALHSGNGRPRDKRAAGDAQMALGNTTSGSSKWPRPRRYKYMRVKDRYMRDTAEARTVRIQGGERQQHEGERRIHGSDRGKHSVIKGVSVWDGRVAKMSMLGEC